MVEEAISKEILLKRLKGAKGQIQGIQPTSSLQDIAQYPWRDSNARHAV